MCFSLSIQILKYFLTGKFTAFSDQTCKLFSFYLRGILQPAFSFELKNDSFTIYFHMFSLQCGEPKCSIFLLVRCIAYPKCCLIENADDKRDHFFARPSAFAKIELDPSSN